MTVRAYLEFEIDIDDIDRQCVKDAQEYAKDLCQAEMASVLKNHDYGAEDFVYEIIGDDKQN